MKTKLGLVGATLVALVASIVVAIQPAQAAVGIRVSGSRLLEGNGTPLVLRGINHAHTWYPTQTSSFANIKAAGANAVRVVLSGGRWQPANNTADVANVISLCKTNRLICVLENHDTTGFGEQSGAVSLDAAVNYWISVQSALTGQENYVILNIGNEPIGNNAVTPAWPQATSSAITRLRNAGFQHTIMVDAPAWGQDWQNVMRDNAPSVLAADPSGNTIFSVHMYGVYNTASKVTSYINSFTSRNLALCVCEFGDMHSDGDPDEDTIMSATQAAGIGNMGWSWSGNGGGVEYLDMVTNFNPAQRSAWGTRYITGANGLSSTSREATIFGGSGGDTSPPTVPGTPTASAITATSVNLSWTASTDNVGVTGYDIYRAPGASGGTFTSVGTATGTTFTNTGLTASTTYRYQVRARDAAGNTSAFSTAVTITTSASGADTSPPTVPGTPTASAITATSVNLSWTASTDNVGVTGYDIYRAPGASGGTFTSVGTATGTTFTNTGLTASTTYRYQVRARDAAGNTSAFSTAVTITTSASGADTSPPTVPGTPTASAITATSVNLSWTASTDNVGVTGYDIYRAPGASGGTFTSVGTATGTTFTNTGLTASTTYRYQVRARDAAGNTSAFSTAVTITTSASGGTGGCTATYSQTNSWNDGFQGAVTVTNTGTAATTGWTVTVTFANGQSITQIWSARTSQTASPYTVTNETYNGAIAPNATTSFGFLGSWSGTNNPPTLACTRTQ